MRTRAQAKEAAAAGEADAPASRRRGRARAELAQADTARDRVATEPQPVAVTAVRMVSLDEGLYALRVGEIDGTTDEIAGMTVPAAQVGAPFAEDGNGVEIIASFPGRGPWIGREGGDSDPEISTGRWLCRRYGVWPRGAIRGFACP